MKGHVIDEPPYVSVIMPVLNSRHYLAESITSILNQNYQNFELIIIDDNSNDGSIEVINEYKQENARITLIVNMERVGIANSLTKGISIAKGEYIARMDADDVCARNRLSS